MSTICTLKTVCHPTYAQHSRKYWIHTRDMHVQYRYHTCLKKYRTSPKKPGTLTPDLFPVGIPGVWMTKWPIHRLIVIGCSPKLKNGVPTDLQNSSLVYSANVYTVNCPTILGVNSFFVQSSIEKKKTHALLMIALTKNMVIWFVHTCPLLLQY